jgi:hypothetical protein
MRALQLTGLPRFVVSSSESNSTVEAGMNLIQRHKMLCSQTSDVVIDGDHYSSLMEVDSQVPQAYFGKLDGSRILANDIDQKGTSWNS